MENQTNNHSELEEIKNEIITQTKNPANKTLPWGNIMVTVVLGVLTLVSVAQMADSIYIFKKLKSGNLAPASNSAPANSLQNAPSMVGGC